MEASLDLRLRRIEACEAIRKLIAAYAVGADRKNDPAILGPLFSADAEWQLDGVDHLIGRTAIAEGLSRIAQTYVTWSLHYMVSPLIELADDALSATCRWGRSGGMEVQRDFDVEWPVVAEVGDQWVQSQGEQRLDAQPRQPGLAQRGAPDCGSASTSTRSSAASTVQY